MYPQPAPILGGGSFGPEARALFARMSPTPAYRRKIVINNTIAALIRAGVWSKLDILYLFAADASANALLNWKGATFPATSTASFTTDRGYTGDGVATYISTTYGQGSGQFTQNDHTFGRWERTAGGSADSMGVLNATEARKIQDNGFTTYDGSSLSGTNWATSSVGNIAVTRSGAAGYDTYKNGAALGNTVRASSSLAGDFYLLASNDTTFGPNNFNNCQVSAAYFGKGLAAAEVTALHTALQTYMTAVGA